MRANNFPPCFRLMLLAAGNRASEERLQLAIAATNKDEAWEKFLSATQNHRLGPLVLQRLQAAHAGTVPVFVLQALCNMDKANRVQVMLTSFRMRVLLERFAAEGFALNVLKGLPLSRRVYGDPAVRHSGDLDLLTDEQDLLAKVKLMKELGYRIIDPDAPLSPRRLHTHAKYWKSATFMYRGSGLTVDLHWRLFNNREHRANKIAEDTRFETLELFGCSVSVLAPQDEFVYLAAHGAADEWLYLKSLADVSAALHFATDEQIAEYLARAAALGLMKPVSSSIRLAGEWFGASCEHPMLLPEDEPFHVALRGRVLARLQARNYQPRRSPQAPLSALCSELAQTPGLRSAREIAGRYLWRPRVWKLIDLPDQWFWLYPLLALLLPPRVTLRNSRSLDERSAGVSIP